MDAIHKKGSSDKCENYIGNAVIDTVSKIYGKLLKSKTQ